MRLAMALSGILVFLGLAACEAGTMAEAMEEEAKGFSYDAWAEVLQTYVNEEGLVDYKGLAENRSSLEPFISQIAAASPKNRPELYPTRDHELAYYVNAYNALVFDQVLDRGADIDSVWGFTGTGVTFFAIQKVKVGGRNISLKSLEDDIIRAEYEDPRIHAALNCASISCPRLPQVPFWPETLQEQLDGAMEEFVADERNVEVKGDKVILSKIFDWFSGDFLAYEEAQGVTEPSILGYVNRYRPEGQKLDPGFSVSYRVYDKGLNRQS